MSRSTRVEAHEGATWVGWASGTVLIGSAAMAVWSLAWLIDAQYDRRRRTTTGEVAGAREENRTPDLLITSYPALNAVLTSGDAGWR